MSKRLGSLSKADMSPKPAPEQPGGQLAQPASRVSQTEPATWQTGKPTTNP